jgi:hypothetical protein
MCERKDIFYVIKSPNNTYEKQIRHELYQY